MAEKQFTRIAHNPKTEVVSLEWQETVDGAEPNKFAAEMREPPHDHFLRAFKQLAGHVLTICELKGIDPTELEVRAVTLKYKDDVLGATIHAVRKLAKSNSPMNLHTPMKWAATGNEGEDGDTRLSEFAEECIQDLADEALLYLDDKKRGPAKQTDAFEDTSGTPAEGEGEEEGAEQGELAGAGV